MPYFWRTGFVSTTSTAQTLQAHPLREKWCLKFKKLRWISISHCKVSESSAKAPGSFPASSAYQPELSSPCLVMWYVCVHASFLLLWEQDKTYTSLHCWYFRKSKAWRLFECREHGMRSLPFAMGYLHSLMLRSEVWSYRGLRPPWTFPFLHTLCSLFTPSRRVELGWT